MTETDKMEACKRAYAEMILNTAKEAAARVMVAELKARRFEHDLISSKETTNQILVRSKQLIDAKTKEGEITSLNQQRKIDELDAQLNEAEGVILDLRFELDQAREQVNEANNKTVNPLRQNEILELTKSNPSNTSSNVVSEGNIHHGKHEAGSVVRRSTRKRKLKLWDDTIAACGLSRSLKRKT